jgi:ADP-L-glycero-D-manno-heptose 6-epimerase
MIGQMIQKARRGEAIKLFKWGDQRRDWVYIDDVVKANLLAMQSDASGIFNIGSGQAYTFNEIAKFIQKELYLAPYTPEYIDCPFSESYQDYTECCVEKAKTAFGYIPKYDVYQGIKAYIRHERQKA